MFVFVILSQGHFEIFIAIITNDRDILQNYFKFQRLNNVFFGYKEKKNPKSRIIK